MEPLKFVLFGLIGAVSALAVNRTIAVYHDGLRTSMLELTSGQKSRKDLTRYAYSISASFLFAYALPYSLASGVVMMHMIFLGVDIIGVRIAHPALATLSGLLYGVMVSATVDGFLRILLDLHVDRGPLQSIWEPVAVAVPMVAAVAAGRHFGTRWGIVASAGTAVVWVGVYSTLRTIHEDSLDAVIASGAIALAITTIVVVAVAIRAGSASNADVTAFAEKISAIQRNWPVLMVASALIAVAASQMWLAGDPAQTALIASGHPASAAAVAFVGTIGYAPVIGMTGMVSGVWIQQGIPDWILGIGYLAHNPIIAAVGGALALAIEMALLKPLCNFLVRNPSMSLLGNAFREAFDIVPTYAILAGAVAAAAQLASAAGVCAVIAAFAFNETKGRPLSPLGVPIIVVVGMCVLRGLSQQAGFV
jgi:hypothetical protein